MVCSSQPAATLAGLDILRRGGNAVDAALAAAACLCVAEPMSNGIGGDGFALVWDGSAVHGLDAGGAAPQSADESAVVEPNGPSSVVTPALLAGWLELSRRFGRLGLDVCIAPAVDLAERGVAAGYHCAYSWARAANAPTGLGRPPQAGQTFVIPDLSRTLRIVAEEGVDAFYKGALAESITGASWLEPEDLASVRPQWVEPLSVPYRGVDVFEMPAPTQGVAALEALSLVERLGEPSPANLVTAVALALEDALREVRDGADVSHLLDRHWLARRARASPRFGLDLPGGTVYLCVVDGDGMGVSLIQSLYGHFGSGVLVPGTGIVLNNRAACFDVVGRLQPGRRPYHTTIPGMLVREGRLMGPFGVMGGFLQAQAHVQLVSSVVDRGLDPQAALDRPRFRIDRDAICLEEGLWSEGAAYSTLGAQVVLDPERLRFGGGQMIQLSDDRIFGGSDARKDGFAAGY
ncbi:MAG TPA: gamma-glutamyltransferase [Acidimicrobiales bacterium]|nr:gamma-glutamyltransferase [Acidimicrobiales bacterium]